MSLNQEKNMKIKKTGIKTIVTVPIFIMLCASLMLTGCGGDSADSLKGEYTVVESNSSDHPVGDTVSFDDGVATNMWPTDRKNGSLYDTMDAVDGFTAMMFEPYAGIEDFTYYLKKDGKRIEVWSAIGYSLRNNDAGPGYSFVIEKK
jgi:hypothetical protein